MVRAGKKIRLTRDEWLAQALDVLAEDPEHLRIDEIAARLGVSKGSFYWHFESRAEFVRTLAEYWRDVYTLSIAEALEQHVGTGEERLLMLMKLLLDKKSAQYDLAVRAWARHEPGILPLVVEADEARQSAVRSIFADMGFEEPELSIRARVFVVYHSFDRLLSIQQDAAELLEARHAFFTRP